MYCDNREKEVKEIVDDVLKNYGMLHLLNAIINNISEFDEHNEKYIGQLKSDLEVTLKNYKNRYDKKI